MAFSERSYTIMVHSPLHSMFQIFWCEFCASIASIILHFISHWIEVLLTALNPFSPASQIFDKYVSHFTFLVTAQTT